MSKAFTKESDEVELFAPPRAPLPPGTPNYITKAGAEKIHAELAALLARKKSLSETELTKFDVRIQQLQVDIASFVVVEPSASDMVKFGAKVTFQRGAERETYSIVGVDEIDLDRNHISWLSPLARALRSRRVGDRVQFQSPGGRADLEILEIA